MITFLMVIEIFLAVSAQLLLRHGATKMENDSLSVLIALEPFRNVFVMSGLALHGLSFFLYIYILSRLQLSIVYPIATGASIVLIALFSVLFLGEHLTLPQRFGIVTILLGIFLVYLTG